MQEFILEIINKFGYLGVFLLITVENLFPPIPSEIILTFSGFATTISDMKIWTSVVSATLGSVLGAIILYMIGRLLNMERLERLFDSRLGRALHLKKEDVRKAESWFGKYDKKAIFFCRFVPIARSLISIPAGMSNMSLKPFIFLTSIGTFIWNVMLIYLGRLAGETWGIVASYMDFYSMFIVVVLGLTALISRYEFIKKRFTVNVTNL
ncbi:DedA family protein [Alkaliphilus sp. MSJ-5]|uniref:DedA family protein n=1 Tax=Alkaliphilus flagellatus TaxID=2841507 RepID=A0ABS6G0G7_9FIRM|nr:DedA family protein [Alkaliphilus flagellatus]MBU5675694.1 DedA family protein [Alkaliphilus flagellatus]